MKFCFIQSSSYQESASLILRIYNSKSRGKTGVIDRLPCKLGEHPPTPPTTELINEKKAPFSPLGYISASLVLPVRHSCRAHLAQQTTPDSSVKLKTSERVPFPPKKAKNSQRRLRNSYKGPGLAAQVAGA